MTELLSEDFEKIFNNEKDYPCIGTYHIAIMTLISQH